MVCCSAPVSATSGISTSFDEATGTLIVSGKGVVEELYPRSITQYFEDMFIGADHKVKRLVIGEGITEVRNSFHDMYALEEISFPKTLTKIWLSFHDCDQLETVLFPETLDSIEAYSFNFCDGITQITFESAVSVSESFYCLKGIKQIEVADGSYLYGSFYDCPRLEKVVLKGAVALVDEDGGATYSCFKKCKESLTVYSAGAAFRNFLWANKRGFASVDLGFEQNEGVVTQFDEATGTLTVSGNGEAKNIFPRRLSESNGDADFEYNPSASVVETNTTVKRLVIEEGITKLYNCFNDMQALQEITFPQSLAEIKGCFMDCDVIQSVKFPDTLTSFCDMVFTGCDSLREISFGDMPIECIDGTGQACFSVLPSLKRIVIPDGSVLQGAFANCNQLESIYLGKSVQLLPLDTETENKNFHAARATVYLAEQDPDLTQALKRLNLMEGTALQIKMGKAPLMVPKWFWMLVSGIASFGCGALSALWFLRKSKSGHL